MKKILVILPELESGGGQRIALEIVRNINDCDVDIEVLSLYPRQGNQLEKFADDNNIIVHYLQKKSGFDIKVIPQIAKALKKIKPDVVHAHLRVMPYIIASLMTVKFDKVYYTVHNMADTDASGIHQKIIRFAFRVRHVIPVAISHICQKSIMEVYGLPEKNIKLIYNGIDVERFFNPNEYEPINVGSTIKMIATGRLMEQKNHILMVEVFAEVCKKYPNSELVILGEGDLRSKIEDKARELGIFEKIKMPGIVSNVEDYLHKAHIYLMTSNVEGLPLALLEAMAAGLPCVATKAGGIPDIAVNKRNAMLCDIGNKHDIVEAICYLIENPELALDMSKNNVMDSNKYSIKACADSYLELYKE